MWQCVRCYIHTSSQIFSGFGFSNGESYGYKSKGIYLKVSLLLYEEICTGFSCKGCLIALQEILEEWRTCSKDLRFWVENLHCTKLTTTVLKTIFTNISTSLALFTIITGGQYLNEIREPHFRRSSSFYGLFVFPHTWIPLSVNGILLGVEDFPPITPGSSSSARVLIGWPRGNSRYRRGRGRRSLTVGSFPCFVRPPGKSNGTFRPWTRALLTGRVRAFSCV